MKIPVDDVATGERARIEVATDLLDPLDESSRRAASCCRSGSCKQ